MRRMMDHAEVEAGKRKVLENAKKFENEPGAVGACARMTALIMPAFIDAFTAEVERDIPLDEIGDGLQRVFSNILSTFLTFSDFNNPEDVVLWVGKFMAETGNQSIDKFFAHCRGDFPPGEMAVVNTHVMKDTPQ